MIFAIVFAAAAGYAVHIGRIDFATALGLASIAVAVQQASSIVAHRVGILEGYLDALLSKNDAI